MSKGEAHLLKPRTTIVAVLVGCALFAIALAVFAYLLPAQDVRDGKTYGYEYSGARSSSTAFNKSETEAGSMLMFASSELSTPASTVPQIPAAVFGQEGSGLNLVCIGEAFDQSLWHAIAAGAYSQTTKNRKVAILASPGWFVDGGIDGETFGLRFSYTLYRQFCANDQISDASKNYLAKRLRGLGIDDMTVQAGLKTMPQDYLNDFVLAAMDDMKLRRDLVAVRERGFELAEGGSKPDFAALSDQALADAMERSTNNDMGIDDNFYANNLDGRLEELAGTHTYETYTDTPEYDDFNFFLKVCEEVGFEPLVVISPLKGEYYDLQGASRGARERCYDRMRTICEKHGVKYADFSGMEYSKYFLHDIVHFGGPGWVAVEEAVYDFATR